MDNLNRIYLVNKETEWGDGPIMAFTTEEQAKAYADSLNDGNDFVNYYVGDVELRTTQPNQASGGSN